MKKVHHLFSRDDADSDELSKYIDSDRFTEDEYKDLLSGNYDNQDNIALHDDALNALKRSKHNTSKNNVQSLIDITRKLRSRGKKPNRYMLARNYREILENMNLEDKHIDNVLNGKIQAPGEIDQDDLMGYISQNPNFSKKHVYHAIEKDPSNIKHVIESPNLDDRAVDLILKNKDIADHLNKYVLKRLSKHPSLNSSHAENILNNDNFKDLRVEEVWHNLLDKMTPEKRKEMIDKKLGITGGNHTDEDLISEEDNWDNWNEGPDYNKTTAEFLSNYKNLDDSHAEHIKRHGTNQQKFNLFHNTGVDPKHGAEMYKKWANDNSDHGYDLDDFNDKIREEHEDNLTEGAADEAREAAEENYTFDDYLSDMHHDVASDPIYEEEFDNHMSGYDWSYTDPETGETEDYSEDRESHPDYNKRSDEAEEKAMKYFRHNAPEWAYDGYDEGISEDAGQLYRDILESKFENSHENPDFIPEHLHDHIPEIKDFIQKKRDKKIEEAKNKAEEEEEKNSDFLGSSIPNRSHEHEYGEGLHHHEMLKDYADANNGSIDSGTMNKLYPNLKEEWKGIFGNKGKLSSEEIKQKIDSIPKTKYNLSYRKWDPNSAQNLNEQDQVVFRLDHSPESYAKIAENPEVQDTFHKVQEVSQRSGHPTNFNTIAWARVDTSNPKHWMVDEVQSDFGSSVRDYLKKEGREDKADHISKIEDAHKDWRENILNAVIKAAKAHGVEKISTHSPESKSEHTGSGNIHSVYEHSYKKVPRRMGFKPSHPSELPLTDAGKKVFQKQSGSKFDVDNYAEAFTHHLSMAQAHDFLSKDPSETQSEHEDLRDQHFNEALKHQSKITQLDPTHKIARMGRPKKSVDNYQEDPEVLPLDIPRAKTFEPYNEELAQSLSEQKTDQSHPAHTLDLKPQFLKKHLIEVEFEDLVKNEIFGGWEDEEEIDKSEKTKDIIPGGLADKKKPSDFDKKQLKIGTKVEMEHTNNKKIAQQIAMDHLTEDPLYYKKLATIEKSEFIDLKKSPPLSSFEDKEERDDFARGLGYDGMMEGEKHLGTYKVPMKTPEGDTEYLYHHVIAPPEEGSYTHLLSKHRNPRHYGIGRITGDMTRNDVLTINSSGIDPKYHGKGLGKALYQSVLNHHGNIESDEALSPDSERMWRKLSENPENQVHFGEQGTPQRHIASAKNHPKNNFERMVKVKRTLEPRSIGKSENDLEKGALSNLALTAGLVGSLAANAPTHSGFDKKSERKEKAIDLHDDLKIISMIESSGGKNKKHARTTAGLNTGHTAAGSTGLMPITMIETLKKNPKLYSKYSKLLNMSPDEMTNHINKNPHIENEIANHHWNGLGKIFGDDKARKAYAWRNGITASKKAPQEVVDSHPYVKKFKKYSNPKEAAKFAMSKSERDDDDDYRGYHQAPNSLSETDKPMHDLNGIYPEDIYSNQASRLYGHGVHYDNISIGAIQSSRNKPRAAIRVYRAVPHVKSNEERIREIENHKAYILKTGKIPKGVVNFNNKRDYFNHISEELDNLRSKPEEGKAKKLGINPGDWVTTSKQYAKDHGESNLGGKYKIVSKLVPAKHLWSDGNSIHEWGYDPSLDVKSKRKIDKSETIEKGERGDWRDHGLVFKVTDSLPGARDRVDLSVYHPSQLDKYGMPIEGKGVAGFVHFKRDQKNKTLEPLLTHVSPEFRRMGLASAMYNHIEDHTKNWGAGEHKVIPGGKQSDDAKALWQQKDRQFGKFELYLNDMSKNDIKNTLGGIGLATMMAVGAQNMGSSPDQIKPKASVEQPKADKVKESYLAARKESDEIAQRGDRANFLNKISNYHRLNENPKKTPKYGIPHIVLQQTIKNDPALYKEFPYLTRYKGDMLKDALDANPELEERVANKHYDNLSNLYGSDHHKIAHAWSNGINKTNEALQNGKDLTKHPDVKNILTEE